MNVNKKLAVSFVISILFGILFYLFLDLFQMIHCNWDSSLSRCRNLIFDKSQIFAVIPSIIIVFLFILIEQKNNFIKVVVIFILMSLFYGSYMFFYIYFRKECSALYSPGSFISKELGFFIVFINVLIEVLTRTILFFIFYYVYDLIIKLIKKK